MMHIMEHGKQGKIRIGVREVEKLADKIMAELGILRHRLGSEPDRFRIRTLLHDVGCLQVNEGFISGKNGSPLRPLFDAIACIEIDRGTNSILFWKVELEWSKEEKWLVEVRSPQQNPELDLDFHELGTFGDSFFFR